MPLHVLLATMLAAAPGVAQVRDAPEDEREILRVEATLCRAFETGEVAALRRHLEPSFTLVDSRGSVTGLAQTIAEVEGGDPVYEECRNHDQKIRQHGDAAIVTGITSIRSRTGNGDVFEGDFRFTDTWIHRDGA